MTHAGGRRPRERREVHDYPATARVQSFVHAGRMRVVVTVPAPDALVNAGATSHTGGETDSRDRAQPGG
jgi:hypothetical protein